MSDADALLREGDLSGARAVLTETLKRAPADQPARLYLFQLLCVMGEWDKAQSQLRSLASVSPEAQILAANYSQAIEAERTREAVFAGREAPTVLVSGHAWAGEVAAALAMEVRGEDGAEDRRLAAFDQAADTPGRLNDVPFDWIADADPRFGPTFEAIVAGRWGLIPFDAVEFVVSEGPRDLRDLIWLPAQVMFRTGQSANAVLPTRYPGLSPEAPADMRLARATGWTPDGRGVGARLWTFDSGDDVDVDVLSLRSLRFERPA